MSFKYHAIELSIDPSYKLDQSDFIQYSVSLFNRYKSFFRNGLRVTNMENHSERSSFLNPTSQSISKAVEEIQTNESDLIILSTEEKYAGQFRDHPDRKADMTCSLIQCKAIPSFRYGIDLVFYRRGLERLSRQALEDLFVEMATQMGAYYGYAQVLRYPVDSVHGQNPAWGPDRLEWLNWFGSCYEEVFDARSIERIPIESVSSKGRRYYYLKLCNDPNDYFRLSTQMRMYKYMRMLGSECFSRRLEGPLAFFMNRKDAKRIPDYKSF